MGACDVLVTGRIGEQVIDQDEVEISGIDVSLAADVLTATALYGEALSGAAGTTFGPADYDETTIGAFSGIFPNGGDILLECALVDAMNDNVAGGRVVLNIFYSVPSVPVS